MYLAKPKSGAPDFITIIIIIIIIIIVTMIMIVLSTLVHNTI